MTDKNWEAEFDTNFMPTEGAAGLAGYLESPMRIYAEEIKLFIKQLLERQTRCQKTIEGDGICGVKLDCHLHNWRANI